MKFAVTSLVLTPFVPFRLLLRVAQHLGRLPVPLRDHALVTDKWGQHWWGRCKSNNCCRVGDTYVPACLGKQS